MTVLAVLLAGLASVSPLPADESPAVDQRDPSLLRVKAQLEQWKVQEPFPEGITIRVEADLLSPREEVTKAGQRTLPPKFSEHWEFTADQVHRVTLEHINKEWVRKRVETRPFPTRKLIVELLDGGAITIAARKGTGDEELMVGSDYKLGGRSIDVLQGEQELLGLCEHCAIGGYAESDARMFATLYEKLAKHARGAFGVKLVDGKLVPTEAPSKP